MCRSRYEADMALSISCNEIGAIDQHNDNLELFSVAFVFLSCYLYNTDCDKTKTKPMQYKKYHNEHFQNSVECDSVFLLYMLMFLRQVR